VSGQQHSPAALLPRERHGTHFTGGWLGLRVENPTGSIPDDDSGFFIDIIPFRSHYGPGIDSTSKRNEYQEYFLGGKGGRCLRVTTYRHTVPLSLNLGTLTFLEPSGPIQACKMTALTLSVLPVYRRKLQPIFVERCTEDDIFSVCVCNLSYTSCKAHESYCQL